MLRWIPGWLGVMTVVCVSAAYAGSFQVVPIKLYLDAGTPTAVVRVINEGETPLTVQLDAKRWRQDDQGEDVFEDTTDIAFFPLLFTIEKGTERVVRIGYRGAPPAERELTYRLFLEELPVVTPGQTELRFALRIGVPIFVAPAENHQGWRAEGMPITQGRATVRVSNEGSRHVVLTQITAVGQNAQGAELLNKSRKGWYVLAGRSRPFVLPLEEGVCRQLAVMRMTVFTAREQQQVDVAPPDTPSECVPPPTQSRKPPQGTPEPN